MKPRLLAMSLISAVLIQPSLWQSAHAFTPGACKQDEQKFCADAGPGNRRDCMKQHAADLSQACKDNMAEEKQKMQDKMKAIQAACKDDIQKYCANVTPGEGREMACLHSYGDKISSSCKEALPKHMMRKGMRHHGKGAPNSGPDQNQDGPTHDEPGDPSASGK